MDIGNRTQWAWIAVAVIFLAGVGLLQVGASPLRPQGPDPATDLWCTDNGLGADDCAAAAELLRAYGSEIDASLLVSPVFADGTPAPGWMVDAVAVCDGLHPINRTDFLGCVLLRAAG